MEETLDLLAGAEGPYLLTAGMAWWSVALAYLALVRRRADCTATSETRRTRFVSAVCGVFDSRALLYGFVVSQLLLHVGAMVATGNRLYSPYWMAELLQFGLGASVVCTRRTRVGVPWVGRLLVVYLAFTLLYAYWLTVYVFSQMLSTPASTECITVREVDELVGKNRVHYDGDILVGELISSSRSSVRLLAYVCG